MSQIEDESEHNDEPAPVKTRSGITKCKHTNRKFYARGMCKACYNYHGRQKMATACPHTDKLMYARGLCCRCYNNQRY